MPGKIKIFILVIAAVSMVSMVLPASGAASPGSTGQPVLMTAMLAGNPDKITSNQYSSFGFAYPIANYTSILPEYVSMWVTSPGSSNVEVISPSTGQIYLNQTSFPGTNTTNPYFRVNFTLPGGTYDIQVAISSSQVGKTVYEIFSVDVLSPQSYINYEQQKINNAPNLNPISNWEAAGAVAIGISIVATLGTILSYHGWNRKREKKGATNALSGLLSPGGEGD